MATLIHTPLGCIVQGAILWQLPLAVCQLLCRWPERAPPRPGFGLLGPLIAGEFSSSGVSLLAPFSVHRGHFGGASEFCGYMAGTGTAPEVVQTTCLLAGQKMWVSVLPHVASRRLSYCSSFTGSVYSAMSLPCLALEHLFTGVGTLVGTESYRRSWCS